jgi:hypothetical protein
LPLFGHELPGTRARRPVVTIGAAVSSCTGLTGATVIAAVHGDTLVAVVVFLAAQAWIGVELTCRWRLKWRVSRLLEDIAREALRHPENLHLRTLLIDVASTHLDDLGDRLPTRSLFTSIWEESARPLP